MVPYTGTETRVGAIRFLNLPNPIRVVESTDGKPQEIGNNPQLKVVAVEDMWRIDDEWWRDECISRIYYKCLLRDGLQITIFRDIQTSIWYKQND